MGIIRLGCIVKFWYIIRLERIQISFRIFLWKKKRFTYASILGYMGKVRTSIYPVVSFGGESYPLGITAPGMIGIRVPSVCFFHFINLSGRKLMHPKVRFWMQDGESTIIGYGEQQVFAVR